MLQGPSLLTQVAFAAGMERAGANTTAAAGCGSLLVLAQGTPARIPPPRSLRCLDERHGPESPLLESTAETPGASLHAVIGEEWLRFWQQSEELSDAQFDTACLAHRLLLLEQEAVAAFTWESGPWWEIAPGPSQPTDLCTHSLWEAEPHWDKSGIPNAWSQPLDASYL